VQSTPGDVAWDGSHVWVASYATTQIQCVDPSNCTIVSTIPAPGSLIGGLAWDGSALWACPEQDGHIYRIDPSDGSVLAVINGTGVGDGDPNGTGLAWDGQYLWQNDHTDDRIYQLDPSDGSVIRSIPAPSTWAGGLGYHAGVLVYYDVAGGQIFQLDAADGTVLDSCHVPATQHWGMDVNDAGEVIDGGISFDKIYVMDADVGLFDNFCVSTVNSSGGAALLSGNGSPSIAENNLTLTATPVPNQTFIFFFGPNQIQIPFGNGWQCVGGGITRILPPATATGNKATRTLNLPGLGITPGTQNFQCWFRDPPAGGSFFNTSDGLKIQFVP
jgi:outer membrane protein assembly factor BamB